MSKAGYETDDKAKSEPKADKPPAKPADKAADSTKTKPKAGEENTAVKQQRAEIDRLKGELDTKSKAYTDLEKKISEAEAKGKDVSAMTERLTRMEKALGEREAELRMLKHEASPEFKAKYDKPFNEMAAKAASVVERLTVVADEISGTPERKATWEDFKRLYGEDEVSAPETAEKLFGPRGAAVAMKYYNELHALNDQRETALKEEREHASERQKEQEGKEAQQREQISQTWHKLNKELSDSEQFAVDPTDKDLVSARDKTLAIFDTPPKTLTERLVKDAHIRQRVAKLSVVEIKLARAQKEIDDLKKKLEKETEDIPGGTHRPGGDAGKPSDKEESFEEWTAGARKALESA